MIVLAVFFIFAAIFCLVMGMAWQGETGMAGRLAALRGDGVAAQFGPVVVNESLTSRVFQPLVTSTAAKVQHLLPSRWIAGIEKSLLQAGEPTSLTGFLFVTVLCEATALGFGFTLVLAGAKGGMSLVMIGVAALLGVAFPKLWLSNRVRYRQKVILKSLPDAFDLVTTCVEAGLGLEAALARVAEKVEGPFGEELAVTLREVSMGKLRRDALRELSDRTGVPDLVSFINAIVQAETMGTSIATVLRVQAEQMRVKRRQRAEQQAYQAPVKMVFPLVLCIFPTLFIVILGPAAINIYRTLIQK